MQSPFYFIARPVLGKRYDNTRTYGDVEFIVSASEEDHRFSNRMAEVIEVPVGYTGPIQKGDTLLVHHNTFKFYNDIKGNRRSGKSFFKDDLFLIEPDQFFMYKHDGKWNAYDRYCFVKPIPAEESWIKKPITNEPLMGVMVYPNERMIQCGVSSGDKVCFQPESEYEFYVDGERLYRMFDHQVTIKLS
jgi:hypothetical protein